MFTKHKTTCSSSKSNINSIVNMSFVGMFFLEELFLEIAQHLAWSNRVIRLWVHEVVA